MFTQTIATKNTVIDKSLKIAESEPLLPRGSALITTSGKLAEDGISAIINAATGSMNLSGGIFDPTTDSTKHSIANAFTLLNVNKFKKIAVPYICGGIFKSRMGITDGQLAKLITDACFKANPETDKFVIVMNSSETYELFKTTIATNYPDVDLNSILIKGSITDYNAHHCDTIMNASNMEVQFGGGMAGAIGRATGEQVKIDTQALTDIKTFWKNQN